MTSEKKTPSKWYWRCLRVLLLAGGILFLGLVLWFLFFPVPIGWTLQLASSFGRDSELRLSADVQEAYFRWNLGEENFEISLGGLAVDHQGSKSSRLLSMDSMLVAVRKGGFLGLTRPLPARVEIGNPVFLLDVSSEDAAVPSLVKALGQMSRKEEEPPAGPLDLSMLRQQMECYLAVTGLRVDIKTKDGDVNLRFKPINAEAKTGTDGDISAGIELALEGARNPVGFTAGARGNIEKGNIHYWVRVPGFSWTDLPDIPIARDIPEGLGFTFAFSSEGDLRLEGETPTLEKAEFSVLLTDTSAAFPGVNGGLPVKVGRVDVSGTATMDTLKFSKCMVWVDAFRVNVDDFQAGLTPRPGVKMSMQVGTTAEGVSVKDVSQYLPPELLELAGNYFPDLDALRFRSAGVNVNASLPRLPEKGEILQPDAFDVKAEFHGMLQGQELSVGLDARRDAGEREAAVNLRTSAINPSRLQIKGLPMPLEGINIPVSMKALARLDMSKEQPAPKSGTLWLEAGEGSLRPPLEGVDAVIRMDSIKMEAFAEAPFEEVTIRSLEVSMEGGVMQVSGEDLRANKDAMRASGTIRAKGFGVPWAYQFWPKETLPELRGQVMEMLKQGHLAEMVLRFDTPLNLKNPESIRPDKLQGMIRIADVTVVPKDGAGTNTLKDLLVNVNWPKMEVHASGMQTEAFSVTEAAVFVEGLDKPELQVRTQGAFSSEIGKVRAWANVWLSVLGQPELELPVEKLDGIIRGQWTLSAPLNPEKPEPDLARIQADLKVDVDGFASELPLEIPDAKALLLSLKEGEASLAIHYKEQSVIVQIEHAGGHVNVPDMADGPLSFSGNAQASLPGDSAKVEMLVDINKLKLSHPMTQKLPKERQPFAIQAEVQGLRAEKRAVLASFSAPALLGVPVVLTAHRDERVTPEKNSLGAELGRSRFTMDYVNAPGGKHKVDIHAPLVDMRGLLTLAGPFLSHEENKSVLPSDKQPGEEVLSGGKLTFDQSINFSFTADDIDFGDEKHVYDLKLKAELEGLLLRGMSLEAKEGSSNSIRWSLLPEREIAVGAPYVLQGRIMDVCAAVEAVSASLVVLEPFSADMAELSKKVREISESFAGGEVLIQGKSILPDLGGVSDINRMLNGVALFDGTLSVKNIRMLKAPLVLRMLAMKTKKTLMEQPMIEVLSLGNLKMTWPQVQFEQLGLEGAGLLELKLQKGSYNLVTDALTLDGSYFGIGFEVIGTASSPDVYLKDNVIIRAIGNTSDLHFGD